MDGTILSDKIVVFPATRRSNDYWQSARIITEESITRQYRQLYNGGNFVITDIPDGTVIGDNQEFEFIINGYYVKIKDLKLLLSQMLDASDNGDADVYAIMSMETVDGFVQIANGDIGGDYWGIYFDKTEPQSGIYLNLCHFTKNGSTYTLNSINSRPTIDGGEE